MKEELKTIKYEDWKAEGVKLFGPDCKTWKFKCCNCGHEQTINDFIKAGIDKPENKVHFSCIGRWTGGEGTMSNDKSPCNYTIGGLFNIAKTCVIDQDGKSTWCFAFGTPDKI